MKTAGIDMRAKEKKQGGFSLVEMMVTIGIIAVMGVIAVPALNLYIPRYRVDSATKVVASEMQLARMRATAKNRPQIVTVDPGAQSIVFAQQNPDNSTTTLATLLFESTSNPEPTFPGVAIGRASGTGIPPDSPTSNDSEPVTFGVPGGSEVYTDITFLSNGLSNRSGEIYLMPSGDLATSRSDRSRAVQVLRAGMVRRFKYMPDPAAPTSWIWGEY
jgi:prepilin-type N-terminal cleavage/methylation domain-containing protein